MTTFIEWLDMRLDKRNWSRAKLARKAGVSTTAIYSIASGKRKPGAHLLSKLAKALNLPREEVYRAAGLLQRKSHPIEDVERGDHYLGLMKPGKRKVALDVLEILINEETIDNKPKQD